MLFSIVIPVYNGAAHLHRSVESVLGQSFADFELLIVNDGSTDDTAQRASALAAADPLGRVRVIARENGGVSAARNTGILESRGDFVCFLDSDDQWLPGHLAALQQAIGRYPDEVFFSTLSQVCLVDGSIEKRNAGMPGEIFLVEDLFDYELSGKPAISRFTSTICLRRSFFAAHGLFALGVRFSEDEDMWYRAAAYHSFVVVPRITVQRNRDCSEATRRPVYPETDPFVDRGAQLLADARIPVSKRASLRLFIQRHQIRLIRSMIKNGHRKKALAALRREAFDRRFRRQLLITWCSLLLPQPVINRMMERHMDRRYYRG